MTRRLILALSALLLAGVSITAGADPSATSAASADARITNDAAANSYRRFDGATDAVTQACSTGRRQQVEPSVAIDPRDPTVIVAGARDGCTGATPSGSWDWMGYYRSVDGGTSWENSLVPGYLGDATPAGVASPAHGCLYASDPTQGFDREGRLFYGFTCSNPTGDGFLMPFKLYVATYGSDGSRYERTVEVSRVTLPDLPPVSGRGGALNGPFSPDKPNLVVDTSTGPNRGNIYVAWEEPLGPAVTLPKFGTLVVDFPIEVMMVARSTDHGKSFSIPTIIVPPTEITEFGRPELADLAVGPDGTVYLAYRPFPLQVLGFRSHPHSIWLTRSVDGGRTFGLSTKVADIQSFDFPQGEGHDGCGDGGYQCTNGLTYPGYFTLPAVVADGTGVHVLWNAALPGGQFKIFARNSPDGVHWPSPALTVDQLSYGHQFWPDVASAGGVITAVFFDSRVDPSYTLGRPPGVRADGTNPGGAIDAYTARSLDGGRTWSETKVSSVSSNPNFETEVDLRLPFFGDYIYVSAAANTAYAAWTDSRHLVAGTDPREPNETDGFDGYSPCTFTPKSITADMYSSPLRSDPCLSQGGLDLNIYGAGL